MSLARPERTIEDRLREEYFDLLPDIRRVVDELEAEVRHCLVPISLGLDKYERLVVTSRIKECESALDLGGHFKTDHRGSLQNRPMEHHLSLIHI